jgi:hypothetical protein
MLRYCFLAALCVPSFGQSVAGNCAVRGSVVDERGAPVAGLFLTAYSFRIQQGRRIIDIAGLAATNDAGQYCMRHLERSGPVFLVTSQWFDFKKLDSLRHTLPSTWYPAGPDFRSAKPVDPGADARADFRLVTVDTFGIEGKTAGLKTFRRIDLHAARSDGIEVQNGILDVDLEQGKFTIQGLSPGDWTFFVAASEAGEDLWARLQYSVNRDIKDAVLAFAPRPHLKLNVNGKPDHVTNETSKDALVLGLYQPTQTREMQYSFWYMGLPPGAYKTQVASGFDCVESFSPGDVQLSGNNLMITSQKYLRPISVKVGKHCAELTVRLPREVSTEITILLVPESLPFQPIPTSAPTVNLPYFYYPWPLSPGTYGVYAFKTLDGLEYENPAVLRRFSGKTVVLEPGKKTEIALDVVNSFP